MSSIPSFQTHEYHFVILFVVLLIPIVLDFDALCILIMFIIPIPIPHPLAKSIVVSPSHMFRIALDPI